MLGLIGALGSALVGAFGANEANEANAAQADSNRAFNREEAEKSRNFNSAEAAINRDFQSQETEEARAFAERMSSTSYTRAVGDLKNAGINPMLAYLRGGASSPTVGAPSGSAASGAAASHSSIPAYNNRALAALGAASSAIQLENLQKQGDNIDADTALKKASAAREMSSAGNLEATTEKIVTGEIPRIRAEIISVEEDILNKRDKSALMQAQTLLTTMQRMVTSGQIDQVDANTALSRIEAQLKELQIPEAKAYAEKFKGEYGSTVSPYTKEILDILRTLIYGRPR